MKIGLILKHIDQNKCPGIWGDLLWAEALAKGMRQTAPQDNIRLYGYDTGYMPEFLDIAIYFHLPENNKFIGKQNILILQNIPPDGNMEREITKYKEYEAKGMRIATLYRKLATEHNWYLLPACVDMDKWQGVIKDPKDCEYDMVYIGNNIHDQEVMEKYLNLFLRNEYPQYRIGIFGNGFNSKIPFGQDIEYYNNSVVCLNFSFTASAMYDGIIGRPLQLAACKSAIVSQPAEHLQEKFGEGILYVKNIPDIIQAIDYYKQHPDDRHKRILQAYSIVNTHYTADIIGRNLYDWIQQGQ